MIIRFCRLTQCWKRCLQALTHNDPHEWHLLASFLDFQSISILRCRQQWLVSVHFSGYWQEKYSICFWFSLMQRCILVFWSFAASLTDITHHWGGGHPRAFEVWCLRCECPPLNTIIWEYIQYFLSSRVNLSNDNWPPIDFLTIQNIHMYFHLPFCLQARIFLNLPLALLVLWLFLWKK